jgi:flagellar hook protein FlgE
MPFRIALTGLDAASTDLKVTGNNIANSATTGFKYSRPEFADIFAQSFGGISKIAVGGGVRVAAVTQQFDQGAIELTGNNLDLGINGQGFFVLSDGGARVFSRAGAFQVDQNGFVTNSQAQHLQVFQALDPAGNTFNTASPTDLQLTTTAGPPQATTTIDAAINLQADAVAPTTPFDPVNDPGSYNYSTSVTIYDSLGSSHISTLYFRKTAQNQWDAYQYVDGNPITVGGNPASQVTFNPDGSLNTGGTIAYDAYDPLNGSSPLNLNLDLSNATQFGANFAVNGLNQDGFTTGRLNNIQVDETGAISARYTNGQFEVLGKVALGNFANPQGLQQLGDNVWAESFSSGALQLGEAGTGSLGLIQSGGLEASNVDIAEQLVNLITAQRNYQANAQVISTADTIAQTIINIR